MQMMLTSPQGQGPGASIPKFQVWQQQTSVFKDVAAYDFAGPGFNITGDRPELIHGIHDFRADAFPARMRTSGSARILAVPMLRL